MTDVLVERAHSLMIRLVRAGLVDEIGRPLFEDPDGGPIRRGGRSMTTSPFSGDQIDAYEMTVCVWDGDSHDPLGDHFADGFVAWTEVLFIVAGDGWSIGAMPVARDAEIDPELERFVLDLFGGDVVAHRDIPSPQWFEARYTSAAQVIDAACRVGFAQESSFFIDSGGPLGEELRELAERGQYAHAFAHDQGSEQRSALHVVIENRFAADAVECAVHGEIDLSGKNWGAGGGDGWAFIITSENVEQPVAGGADIELSLALRAAALCEAIDGTVVRTSAALAASPDPVVLDAARAIGRLARLPNDIIEKLARTPRSNTWRRACPPHIAASLESLAHEWRDNYVRSRMLRVGHEVPDARGAVIDAAFNSALAAAGTLAALGTMRADSSWQNDADPELRHELVQVVLGYETVAGSATADDNVRRDYRVGASEAHFDLFRTRTEVNELLVFAHIIPVKNGLHTKHVAVKYPGWSWNELMTELKAADALDQEPGASPVCRADVESIHLGRGGTWAVDVLDGTTRRDPDGAARIAPIAERQGSISADGEKTPAVESREAESQNLKHYRLSGRDDLGDRGFGCAAAAESDAIRFAGILGLTAAIVDEITPLPHRDEPLHARNAIVENPLLGPEWLPLADAIAAASECARSGGLWQMNTYPRHTGFDPGPAPYVQGLVENDGTHHLEVGGHGRGPDWSSAETLRGLDLLGWTQAGADSRANWVLTLESSWTGHRVAREVLEIFVSIYGHEWETPIAFGGSNAVREAVLSHLTVLQPPDVLIQPSPPQSTTPSSQEDDSGTSMGDSTLPSNDVDDSDFFTQVERDAIATVATDLGLSADEIIAVLERQFYDGPPDADDGGGCLQFDPEALAEDKPLTIAEALRLLNSALKRLPHLSRAISALELLDERQDHIGHLVDWWTLVTATSENQELLDHEHCSPRCVMRDPVGRILVAACSTDALTVHLLRYHTCRIVSDIARERDVPDVDEDRPARLQERAVRGAGCGPLCEDAAHDMSSELRYEGLKRPSMPAVITRGLRRYDSWFWATRPEPLPAHDYHPWRLTHMIGLLCDQFAVTHSGHGMNSYSVNLRLVTGHFAFLGQAHRGFAYSDRESTEAAWERVCEVAEALGQLESDEWDPARYQRRPWLVTFSDFRDGPYVSAHHWTISWIGEGQPWGALPTQFTLSTEKEAIQTLHRIRGFVVEEEIPGEE